MAGKTIKDISVAEKPARIRVEDESGDVYFITIFKTGALQIRPKGTRSAGSEVFVTVGQVYRNGLMRRAQAEKPKRRRPVSRGLVSTERRRKP